MERSSIKTEWWESESQPQSIDTSFILEALSGIMKSKKETIGKIIVSEDVYNIYYSLEWWVKNMSKLDRFVDLYLPFLSPYKF
jgi:hypothetical protein